MRNLRKLTVVVCAALLVIGLHAPLTTYSQEIQATASMSTANCNEFDVLFITDGDHIAPDATWIGNGGFSTLDYMSSAQAFAWSIDITEVSSLPLTFSGAIDIYTQSTGVYRGTVYISGSGLGKASGVGYVSPSIALQRGVNYVAKYSGTAVNSIGLKAKVVPGASIVFNYR